MIRVSHDMKGRDGQALDFNYQLNQDKEQLTRQTDMLKKELHEVKERFSSLELVEQELLH